MADTTTGGARKPTEKEAFFFLTILGAMKNKPEVDWDLVAERAGYSNAISAKVRFGQIKKALGFLEDGTIGTPTPVKSRAKKEKTVGSGTNTTPSKVTKKASTPRKLKAPKVKKGELAGLQAATDSFLSSASNGNSAGNGATNGNGGPVKYEDDDDDDGARNDVDVDDDDARDYEGGARYYDAEGDD